MTITTYTNQQLTLLEIYLSNYKHFRLATTNEPTRKREFKSQMRSVHRFNHWLVSVLPANHKEFLLNHNLLEVMFEVHLKIKQLNHSHFNQTL